MKEKMMKRHKQKMIITHCQQTLYHSSEKELTKTKIA